MTWSQNQIQVTWGGSNTYSLAGGGAQASDDFTASSDLVYAEMQCKVDHGGTPASGNTVDFYLRKKGDPDQDSTLEYDSVGDYLTTLDPYDTDPAVRTVPVVLMQGATYQLHAVNNDGDTSQTVSARITESKWS